MRLWNTYYDFPLESDYSGAANTALRTQDGSLIAMVPQAFAARFCIEGSGRLRDGRVVNYGGPCHAGVQGLDCNAINRASIQLGANSCYTALDPARYPWGAGNHGKALVPLRSIATDHAVIPFGSTVYIAEFDGRAIPRVGELGGFVHDGRFTADDSGGAINGNHIDIFAGSEAMAAALERLVPTHSTLNASIGGPSSPGRAAAAVGVGAAIGSVATKLLTGRWPWEFLE